MNNSITNFLFLIVSIMGLSLVSPQSARASSSCGTPTLAGVANLGVLGGQHYYEVNFNMPNGLTYAQWAACVGPANAGIVMGFSEGAPVYQSYSGPAGNSKYQYQVNIYGTPNTGFSEVWFDYGIGFFPVVVVGVDF